MLSHSRTSTPALRRLARSLRGIASVAIRVPRRSCGPRSAWALCASRPRWWRTTLPRTRGPAARSSAASRMPVGK